MNLQEKIRTLLKEATKQKEEIKAPTFFRRRINPDELYKDFRHSLLYVSNYIREKPSLIHFNDYRVDRFKIAVISALIDEYYDMLLDSGGNDFPYDEIYDYLYARYESEMEDEYNDLIDNLQYNINESTFFRRRSDLEKIKDLLPLFVDDVSYDFDNYEDFKYQLTIRALEYYIWLTHNLSWDELPYREETDFVNQISEMFDDTIKELYQQQQ